MSVELAVREKAAVGLAWRRDARIGPALIEAAADPDPAVREKVLVALAFSDHPHAHYGVLVDHDIRGENYEKGIKYSKLAGKKATLTGSVEEAIEYARKTVAALERLPRTEYVQKEIIDVRTVLGAKLADLNYFQEAKVAIDPVIDIALEKGYRKRVSQMFTIIGGRECCVEENFPKAFGHLEMALKIAEELGDIPSIGLANYWLGYARSLNAEY